MQTNKEKMDKTKPLNQYSSHTGHDFHGGYEELYLHKFKQYQSSVGRYLQNLRLKDLHY